MKVIKYNFLSSEINHGTEEHPNIEQVFIGKAMQWSEEAEEAAKREAVNGEYTIEDDGLPEVLTHAQRLTELEEAINQVRNILSRLGLR